MNRLFAYNANVDTYNQRKLDELTSEPAVYQADDTGGKKGIEFRVVVIIMIIMICVIHVVIMNE